MISRIKAARSISRDTAFLIGVWPGNPCATCISSATPVALYYIWKPLCRSSKSISMTIVSRFAVSRLFAQKNANSLNCRELQTREIWRSTEMAGAESLWALRSEHANKYRQRRATFSSASSLHDKHQPCRKEFVWLLLSSNAKEADGTHPWPPPHETTRLNTAVQSNESTRLKAWQPPTQRLLTSFLSLHDPFLKPS
jgi:hypothetical protein